MSQGEERGRVAGGEEREALEKEEQDADQRADGEGDEKDAEAAQELGPDDGAPPGRIGQDELERPGLLLPAGHRPGVEDGEEAEQEARR